LLDPDLALPKGGRSVGTKIEQAAAALRLERTWSKDQILEAWLNLVPFRGEQVGVAAMSQALFQKAASGLNAEESAIAAALLRAPNAEDGAVIVLDNATGDVLAWVGSSGDLSQAAAVDAVVAPRQAGSTLKPFLYEQAIEQRWLTAASVLDDAPTRLHTPSGL